MLIVEEVEGEILLLLTGCAVYAELTAGWTDEGLEFVLRGVGSVKWTMRRSSRRAWPRR